jgi:hypothetical protein
MIAKRILTVLGAVILGAGLIVSPAQAKCVKACKSSITNEFKSCKSGCAKGKAGKSCKATCRSTRTSEKKACRAATAPACSPSGAFVD